MNDFGLLERTILDTLQHRPEDDLHARIPTNIDQALKNLTQDELVTGTNDTYHLTVQGEQLASDEKTLWGWKRRVEQLTQEQTRHLVADLYGSAGKDVDKRRRYFLLQGPAQKKLSPKRFDAEPAAYAISRYALEKRLRSFAQDKHATKMNVRAKNFYELSDAHQKQFRAMLNKQHESARKNFTAVLPSELEPGYRAPDTPLLVIPDRLPDYAERDVDVGQFITRHERPHHIRIGSDALGVQPVSLNTIENDYTLLVRNPQTLLLPGDDYRRRVLADSFMRRLDQGIRSARKEN